jgi:diguanylate cyclase (GGDEF)-like protein
VGSNQIVKEAVFEVSKPFLSLEEALDSIIKCLNVIMPYKLWMISRLNGDDWSVLHAVDPDNKVKAGNVMDFKESTCWHMVRGAPRFAYDAQAVPEYANAPVSKKMKIGAYVGQPLVAEDGSLIGTWCAVHPEKQEPLSQQEQMVVETMTRVMGTLLLDYLRLEKARQVEVQLRYQAHTDGLTGLSNRTMWENVINEEESALKRIGNNAMILMVDLDGLKNVNDTLGHSAGDKYIVAAANVLRQQLRNEDIIARLGGDEFVALIRNINTEEASNLFLRLNQAFLDAGVKASMGYAMRYDHGSLKDALQAADEKMYHRKRKKYSNQEKS